MYSAYMPTNDNGSGSTQNNTQHNRAYGNNNTMRSPNRMNTQNVVNIPQNVVANNNVRSPPAAAAVSTSDLMKRSWVPFGIGDN
jgi:hypothetical protein